MDDKFLVIEQLISKDIDSLKEIVIYCEDDGTYNVYDKYLISKNPDNIYTVEVIGTHTVKYFYKLKNAVAWCSFDKRNMHNRAKRLHQLDQLIFSMDTEIQIHSKLIKKTKDSENKLIYLSKLTQEKTKKRVFSEELNHYIRDYQNWQTGLFNRKPNY